MWEGPSRQGDKYVHHDPSTDYSVDIDGWEGDNGISSVWNRTGCTITLCGNDDFTGDPLKAHPRTCRENLERSGFDNEAEGFAATNC